MSGKNFNITTKLPLVPDNSGNYIVSNDLGVNQVNPQARVHITESTLGDEVLRIESTATNDDPSERVFQNRLTTVDATTTTLHTFPISASTTYKLRIDVVARRTGGSAGTIEDSAGFTREATIKNVAGTATIVGVVNDSYTAKDQSSWDCTIDVNTGNARVRVTGAANNNITWHMTARVYQVST